MIKVQYPSSIVEDKEWIRFSLYAELRSHLAHHFALQIRREEIDPISTSPLWRSVCRKNEQFSNRVCLPNFIIIIIIFNIKNYFHTHTLDTRLERVHRIINLIISSTKETCAILSVRLHRWQAARCLQVELSNRFDAKNYSPVFRTILQFFIRFRSIPFNSVIYFWFSSLS